MDKHMGIAEEILRAVAGHTFASDRGVVTAILRREFPDERNAALIEAEKTCRAIEDGKFVAGAVWHNDAGSCAAAMMVEKVRKSADTMQEFDDSLSEIDAACWTMQYEPGAPCFAHVLLLPPSLIAYCACVALETEQA